MVNTLLGRWKLLTADASLGLDPDAVMHFKTDGELVYIIPERERTSAIRLTYRVDGECLITNQPSAPREERTLFRLAGDDLFLAYEGGSARFRRLPAGPGERAS